MKDKEKTSETNLDYDEDVFQLLTAIQEIAVEKYTEWLKERHEISKHASKREEHMKECEHPEICKIYPSTDSCFDDKVIWHCKCCGFVKYREE